MYCKYPKNFKKQLNCAQPITSKKPYDFSPWITNLLLDESSIGTAAKFLHTLRFISGPHGDGSIVKEGTDRHVRIPVRFTKSAVDAYCSSVDSQSPDTHEEFNRAFIIVKKFWIIHVPHKIQNSSMFELIVDEFSMWMIEEGLQLKVMPCRCMEIPRVKSWSDKLWAEWIFRCSLALESDTDEEVNNVDSLSDELLSQLLQRMPNKITDSNASDPVPRYGGLFSEKMDMATLDMSQIPMVFPEIIDHSIYYISVDQMNQMNSIPGWQLPSTIPVNSPTMAPTSDSPSRNSPRLAAVSRTLNGENPIVSGAVLSSSPSVTNRKHLCTSDRTRCSSVSPRPATRNVIGTMTIMNLPSKNSSNENLKSTVTCVSCSVQVGDSLAENIPLEKLQPMHTDVSAQVGDSLLNSVSSQSQVQGRLEDANGLAIFMDSEALENVDTCVSLSLASNENSDHTEIYSYVEDPVSENKDSTTYDDNITCTQGQYMSLTSERSGIQFSNSNTNLKSPYVKLVRIESAKAPNLHKEKSDVTTSMRNVSNAIPVEEAGDYAQQVDLSYSESDCSGSQTFGDDAYTSTKAGYTSQFSQRHLAISASPTTNAASSKSPFNYILGDMDLARKPLHPEQVPGEADIAPSICRQRKKSMNGHSISVVTVTQQTGTKPCKKRMSSPGESITEPCSSPRKRLRVVAKRPFMHCSNEDRVSDSDVDGMGSQMLENQIELTQGRHFKDRLKSSPSKNNKTINFSPELNIVSDDMDDVQLCHSPFEEGYISSGVSSDENTVSFTEPAIKNMPLQNITQSTFSSKETRSKDLCLHRTESSSDKNLQLSTAELALGKEGSVYNKPLIISPSMFYKSHSSSKKRTLQPFVSSPNVNTWTAGRTLPSKDSTVQKLSFTSSNSFSVNQSPVKILRKLRVRKSSQKTPRNIETELHITSIDSHRRKSVPYHSTQISSEVSPQSTLPCLQLSPIHWSKHDLLDMTSHRTEMRSRAKESLLSHSVRSVPLEKSFQRTLRSHVPGPLSPISSTKRNVDVLNTERSPHTKGHQLTKASLRRNIHNVLEESISNRPDVRLGIDGRFPQLVLERIGFKLDDCSKESSIGKIKKRSHHSARRASGNLSSSSLSSHISVDNIESDSLNSKAKQSSDTCFGTPKGVGSSRRGLRSISRDIVAQQTAASKAVSRSPNVNPLGRSSVVICAVPGTVSTGDHTSTSENSIMSIGSEEEDHGQTDKHRSTRAPSPRLKQMQHNKRILTSSPSLQKEAGKHKGKDSDITEHESSEQETENEVQDTNSTREKAHTVTIRKLRKLRKIRNKNRIEESESDVSEDTNEGTSKKSDSDEEYQPDPNSSKVGFLSSIDTRRSKAKAQLPMPKKARVGTKRGRPTKMNIQLTNAGKMEVVNGKDDIATDMMMILGKDPSNKQRRVSHENSFNSKRQRKLYFDQTVLGDPFCDKQESNISFDSTMPSLVRKNVTKNSQDSHSKLQKVPNRITKIVGLLTSQVKLEKKTSGSSPSPPHAAGAPKEALVEGEEQSLLETLENSSNQISLPPPQQTPMRGGQQQFSQNSLPSYQPRPSKKLIPETDRCSASGISGEALDEASPQKERVQSESRGSSESLVNTLQSNQQMATKQQEFSSSASSDQLVTGKSCSTEVQFQLEDAMKIMTVAVGDTSEALPSIEFPEDLVEHFQQYFSAIQFT